MYAETPGIGATILPVKAIQSPKCHGGFLNCPSVHLRSVHDAQHIRPLNPIFTAAR